MNLNFSLSYGEPERRDEKNAPKKNWKKEAKRLQRDLEHLEYLTGAEADEDDVDEFTAKLLEREGCDECEDR